jgi:hypothetical protein
MEKYSYDELYEVVEKYEKEFKKCKLSVIDLLKIQRDCKVQVTKIVKDGHHKKISEKVEIVPFDHFINLITSIGFFHDKVTLNYSYVGYCVYTMTCTSPDKEKHITRKIDFIKVNQQ